MSAEEPRAAEEIALLTVEVQGERDVVLARQRARQVAELLGFDRQDQARVATAVSEITRNAWEYAGGGRVTFLQAGGALRVRVADDGPGIPHLQDVLDGQYASPTGAGRGIIGARRLVDRTRFDTAPGRGLTVELEKDLPAPTAAPDPAAVAAGLTRRAPAGSPLEEVQHQNQELLRVLDALNTHQAELDQLNRELSDTNRGVLALYAELDEKATELQRASETKSRFLSHMSHEFRTPLHSILGLARLLLDRADGPLTPEQEKQVLFIHRSASALAETVNDLLDTAKIEAGKLTVHAQPFTAAEMFRSLRGVFRPLLVADPVTGVAPVDLVFEDAAAALLPPLHTDEGKVIQILRNLISNALKFTERGEVRVGAVLAEGEDTLRFAVRDTGLGIAPEDRTRIFEEFVQVEGPDPQRRARGTGLGLPLSRRLARLLGGDIAVESEEGVGSTFTLTLPRVYTPPPSSGSGGSDAGLR